MTTRAHDEYTVTPYDSKTFAEILDDYVLVRGDLSAEYAREQLVRIVEQRIADAEKAGYDRAVAEGRNATATSLVQRVDMFARTLETEETSTPLDEQDGTFPMSASNWDLAVHSIADDLRDTVRATSDIVLASTNPTIESVISDMEILDGPLAARLRAATSVVPAAQALREVAYEITAELICCSGDQVHEYEHSICKWAGFARALVLDRAERIENASDQTWTHTKDNTPCASDLVSSRIALCGDHGLEVRLDRRAEH